MCGFVGVFERGGHTVPLKTLERMTRIIAHRGPDSEKFAVIDSRSGRATITPKLQAESGDVGIGFRRLAIIDLSASADQPMTDDTGKVIGVFNGEIYNFEALRQEHLSDYPFRSRTDSEVLFALYSRLGTEAFKLLNGMFSIAIWDSAKHQIVLARDRLGIKPLYYCLSGETLLFGSEIKSLLLYPGVRRGIDPSALLDHFTFQYSWSDRTLFAGIHSLEPGVILSVDKDSVKKTQYWQLRFGGSSTQSFQESSAELYETLTQAIARQTRSDVPVGSYLSGGMDTGSITTIAQKSRPGLHTFTCGFDTSGMSQEERFFDERTVSRQMARDLGTHHHELEVVADDMTRLFPKLVWHLEDPRVGISYQILALARMVNQHVTVVLSGTGGDELFGGYPWRYGRIHGMNDTTAFDHEYTAIWSRLVSPERRSRFFSPETLLGAGGYLPEQGYADAARHAPTDDPLHRALYIDIRGFLQGLLLVEDKLSMAYSLEARVPLLDDNLVELVCRMPADFKFDGHESKRVLKEALKDLLPNETVNRRKQGFTPPDKTWYRGKTRDYVRDLVLSERALDRGYFQPAELRAVWDEHISGTANHRFLLWSLMFFEWMNRIFLDGDNFEECPKHAV
jgi:asparagine synthase (glutamine-hydrolysing)